MVETVGKKLRQSRQRKQISIEEASHETRIRPEQLTALETDDFTNFPNITYARGFLVIYAKYLGVDVSEFVGAFESTNPVGTADYEYLSNKPAPVNAVSRVNWRLWRPLVIGVIVLAVTAFFADLVISYQRLGDLGRLAEKQGVATADANPSPEPQAPSPAAPRVEKPTPLPPAPGVAQPENLPEKSAPPIAEAAATPSMIDNIEVRRAEPVTHPDLIVPPLSSPAPSATPAAAIEKSVTLQPINKTWVKITKDVQGSPPLFEDWFYPDARPLTFRGAKFWIEIRDRDAVKITLDGQPIAYDPPGVMIK